MMGGALPFEHFPGHQFPSCSDNEVSSAMVRSDRPAAWKAATLWHAPTLGAAVRRGRGVESGSPRGGRRGTTVRFLVGATSCRSGFAAAHARLPPLTVHRSDVL